MDVIFFGLIFCVLQGYVAASCGYPGSPAHCVVSFSNDSLVEGTTATYECERGFELLGPSSKACVYGGYWIPEGIPFCVINVAAGKAAMQVSTDGEAVPQRALDGSSSPIFNPDTCSLTRVEKSPWWYVNLLEPYMVQLVRLDFGKSCCGWGKTEIIVRVGNNQPDLGTNPICNRFTGNIEEGHPLFLPCRPPMPGAFVTVHLQSMTPGQLSICEAFVYTDQALPIERCPQFRDQPPGSTATYNGKCYIFYHQQPTYFDEALKFCNSRGGTLVDDSNPALQGFISWELWRRHRDNSITYWLGAVRDAEDPTNLKWVNGKNVVTSFLEGTDKREPCMMLDGSKKWLWSGSSCATKRNFICQHQPKECGRPEQPPNSTVYADGFQVGASVGYSCDDGHLLVGPGVRTCLETGFYDEFPPICKRIDCGFPAEIQHGSYKLINASVSYLSHVQYSCHPGFLIVGRARLVCDIDERWNGPPPRCDVVQCDQPAQISNGRVVAHNSTAFGSEAEYACAQGYRLLGARKITCEASGHWSYPAPFCQPEESFTTTTTTTTTTITPPPPQPTTKAAPTTTRYPILPTRRFPVRPSSPAPFLLPETTHRPRPMTTTIRSTTKIYERQPQKKITVPDSQDSATSHVPHIIVASHPKEDQIFDSGNNIRPEQILRVNVSSTVVGDSREPVGARLNIGAVAALAAFGGLVFLIAIITTIVILVRSKKHNGGTKFRHQASPVCTVASLESSICTSPGMDRNYRQAWQELYDATEAMGKYKGPWRHVREPPKDESELVVTDMYPAGKSRDKRHHHHHHHHREPRHQPDWLPRAQQSQKTTRY